MRRLHVLVRVSTVRPRGGNGGCRATVPAGGTVVSMEPFDGAIPDDPPADPEEWSDEQWLAWLSATDSEGKSPAGSSASSTKIGRVAHSTGGQVLGQAMVGMARAIYGRHDDEVVIVAAADSEPNPDEPFTVHLDPEHPERSSVVFRTEPDSDSET